MDRPAPIKPVRPAPKKPAPQKPAGQLQQAQVKPVEAIENMEVVENAAVETAIEVEIEETIENNVQELAEESALAKENPQTPKKETKKSKNQKEKPAKKQIKEKTEKPKKEKPQKDKAPKEKKKRNKKKIVIIILLIVFVLACAGGGAAALVLINKENNKKLSTPVLDVVQLYSGTVLTTNKIEGATKYEFVITDSNGKTTPISSTTNSLELGSYLNQPGNYSAKARVFGKGEGATSDYTETINFKCYVMLETPKVFVNYLDEIANGYKTNSNLEDDTLSWDAVKNAEKYLVRYGADLESGEVKSIEVEATANEVKFSLNELYKNGTGLYQISVIAIPNDETYYLKSEAGSVFNVEYYAQQTQVQSASYNRESKTLTFQIFEKGNYGNEFGLYITYASGIKEHKIYLNQVITTISDGVVTIETNIAQLVSGDILNMTIITLSDGAYSTNSQAKVVTIS